MLCTLDNLKIGEKAIVKNISGKDDIKRRLLDIGLVINYPVECVLMSPLQDPKAYWIKGALIALRNEDASNILVER